jgi:hypothetical protein
MALATLDGIMLITFILLVMRTFTGRQAILRSRRVSHTAKLFLHVTLP